MKKCGESKSIAPPFMTSAADGREWSASRSVRFTSGERSPGTYWIGGRMDPRAGLDAVECIKIACPCRKSNPDRPAHSLNYFYNGSYSLHDAGTEMIIWEGPDT
jgi:hypothetical protein